MKIQFRTRINRGTLAGSATITLVAALASHPALAQETLSEPSGNEIVVTGLKRSQALQDVPAAITAFDSAALSERQLKNVQDIATSVPGLVYTETFGVSFVAIRGIAPDSTTPAVDPSVAQHIDGVYQPRATNMNLILADLDSVEVLRGPQGTLYGRNATAGVINYNLKKPTEEFGAGGSVTLGNFDRFKVQGYVTGGLGGGLSARISGVYDKHSGYGKNLFTNKRVDGQNTYGVRGALRYEGAGVTIDLSAYHIDTKQTGPTFYALTPLFGADIARFAPVSQLLTLKPREVYADYPGRTRNRLTAASATIAVDVTDDIKLKSITGWSHSKLYQQFDTEPSAAPISTSNGNYDSKFFSQEFNLNAKFLDRVDLVLGAYYAREHFDQTANVVFPNGFNSGGRFFPATTVSNSNDQVANTYALFGDVTVSLTDSLRLLGGLRYNKDNKQAYQTNIFFATLCNRAPQSLRYSSTKGKIGAQFDVTSDIMIYAQYQTGFKAGGYNIGACGDSFDPENVVSREIGMKAQLFDRHLTVNVSAFDEDAKGLQVNKLVTVNGLPANRVENAANARIRGFELETMARLTPAFSVDVNLAYLDAVYQNYQSIDVLTGQNVNLEGFQITRAPKFTINGGANYKFRIDNVAIDLRGEVYHSGKIWYSPFHQDFVAQPTPFTVFNAYINITPDNSPFKLSIYGKNLSNESYIVGANSSSQYRNGRGIYNEPRTYGVEVGVKF